MSVMTPRERTAGVSTVITTSSHTSTCRREEVWVCGASAPDVLPCGDGKKH